LSTYAIKAAVRERDDYRCSKCHMTNDQHIRDTGRQLQVHRLTPGSAYTVEGCVTLCYACHEGCHRGKGRKLTGHYAKVDLARGAYDRLRAFTLASWGPIHTHLRRAVLEYLERHAAEALDVSLDELAGIGPPPRRKAKGGK
jgi:hypothetical protein